MTLNRSTDLLYQYVSKYTTPESEQLRGLNRETHVKTRNPVMLSGHLQGAFLTMISMLMRPYSVLEIGTFTGYSAICLAKGIAEGGKVHTIDINEELADMCAKHWKEAKVSDKIVAHIGNAIDIIPTLKGKFDLIFIDADKVNYSKYYDLVFPMLNVGGLIIADNVLFEGEVLLSERVRSKNAQALHEYNEKVLKDKRVSNLLLPVRDGLMLTRKEKN